MGYTVLPNPPAVSAETRAEAEQLRKDLQANSPAEDWQIFKNVDKGDLSNPLERLYALAYRLLLLQDEDPTNMAMLIQNLDGSETDVTAMRIMIDARSAIDGLPA